MLDKEELNNVLTSLMMDRVITMHNLHPGKSDDHDVHNLVGSKSQTSLHNQTQALKADTYKKPCATVSPFIGPPFVRGIDLQVHLYLWYRYIPATPSVQSFAFRQNYQG